MHNNDSCSSGRRMNNNNNNNNNHRHLALKDDPPSPTDETTCASSVSHSQFSTPTSSNTNNNNNNTELALRQQTPALVVASGASSAALVVAVLPFHILLGTLIVLSLWLALLQNLWRRGQLEYHNMIQTRGLRDYLPSGLVETLTQTSFHEFMVDGTFVEENYHYLLYFIPGISREQLTQFVDRLIPRHRRALHQPGLGNFLGPQFMRILVGDEGLRQQRLTVPRRLDLETLHEGEEYNDGPASDYVRALGLEPASPTATRSGRPNATLTDPRLNRPILIENEEDATSVLSEEEEDLAIDEEVVWDAAINGMETFRDMMLAYMGRSTVRSVGRGVRATILLGTAAVGLGFAGVWAGFWGVPDLRRSYTRPAGSIAITSAVASSATAGLMMMFGWPGSVPKPSDPPRKKG